MELDVASVEGETLQAVIPAVGDQQGWGGTGAVEDETVGAGQLSGGRSLPTEGAEEGALGVVLINEVRAVATGDVDVAVGGERDIGGGELGGGAAVFVEIVVR